MAIIALSAAPFPGSAAAKKRKRGGSWGWWWGKLQQLRGGTRLRKRGRDEIRLRVGEVPDGDEGGGGRSRRDS